jgi:hypothetical protein
MKQFVELGAARVGAVVQKVCANLNFEVVSLPGGSLIAVLLALYAIATCQEKPAGVLPASGTASLHDCHVLEQPRVAWRPRNTDRSARALDFSGYWPYTPTRHANTPMRTVRLSCRLGFLPPFGSRPSVRLVRGHCPRSLNILSPHKWPSETAFYRALMPGTALALLLGEDRFQTSKETHMNNTISSKFAAFAMALAMNSLIIGAVGYLFEIQAHPHLSVISFARQLAAHQWFS